MKWLIITAAVFSELSPAEAERVLKQWSPEEKEGEYAKAMRTGLKKPEMGALVNYAKEYGYDPSPKAVFSLASVKRAAAAKAGTSGAAPSSALPGASAASDDGDYMTFDDVQQDVGGNPPKVFVIDDSVPDDVGSQYDGEPEPPNMNYYTSPRSLMRYPLIKGKPGVRLPTVNNPVSAFAWQLADLLHEKPVFSRSGFCVKLDDDKRGMVLFKDQVFRTYIEETTAPHVVSIKKNKDGTSEMLLLPHTCSGDVSKAVLASRRFLRGLRPLTRVLPCKLPVMRKDGRIELPGIGYDAETKTWIMSDPEASYDSTPMPLAEAVAFFEDLLSEFPFAEDGGRSKAVAIAAILSVFCTALIPDAATKPAFLYVANSEGSGKTTLAKLAALAAQPGDSPVEAAPADEAEWGKKLLSLVISGRRVMILDNLKGNLASAAFEAYLTSSHFTGRVLGGNTEFTGEAGATVLLTGNGVTTSPDLRRRTLMCELFSPLLRPEERVFTKSLDPVRIRELRPQILAACWGLVAAWDAAGRPGASITSASFGRWGDVVGGAVEFAGWACPLAAPQVATAGDTDAADIAALPGELDPDDMRSFAGLAELCENTGLFESVVTDKDFGGNLTPAARSAFGLILRRFDGRVVGVDEKVGAVRFVIEGSGRNRVYGLRQA
jgi:energy-coupling factor transporter ATP-binding protein EcfA2